MKSKQIAYALLFLFLIILALIPIWSVQYPPLYDYPQHLLIMHILGNMGDPKYSTFYSVDWKPYPNLTIYVVGAVLNQFLDIMLVGKLMLSLIIIAFVCSCFFLYYSINKKNWWLGFFIFPFVYNTFFVFGFMNFILGVSLFNFLIGIYIQNKLSKNNWLKKCILFIAIYFTHSMAFLASIIGVFFLEYYSTRSAKKTLMNLAPAIPSIIIGGVYLIQIFLSNGFSDYYIFPLYQTTFLLNLRYIFFPFAPFMTYIEQILVLELAFLSIILMYLTLFQKEMNKKTAYLALIFLIAFILLPFHSKNAGYINFRLLLFSGVAFIGSLSPPQNQWIKRAILGMVILVFIGQIILVNTHFQNLDKDAQEYLSGMSMIESNHSILPLFDGGTFNRMQHSMAYYIIEKGGYYPYLFTFKEYDLLRFKKEIEKPEYWIVDKYNPKIHNQFDYIIYWGDQNNDHLFNPNYELEFKNNRLNIYKKNA